MPPTPDAPAPGSTRRDPIVLLAVAALLLVARVTLAVYETKNPVERPSLVRWVPADSAEVISHASQRPIMYEFGAEWCGPCKLMEKEVFADSKSSGMIDRLVVPVKIVDRSREEGRNAPWVDSLMQTHHVEAFPTLVMVSNGATLDRQEGYPGPSKTMHWITTAARIGQPADTTRHGRSFRFGSVGPSPP